VIIVVLAGNFHSDIFIVSTSNFYGAIFMVSAGNLYSANFTVLPNTKISAHSVRMSAGGGLPWAGWPEIDMMGARKI